MKKLFMLVAVVGALGLGGILIMASRINGIVKGAVETFAPEVVGAPVSLKAVKLSPFSGKGELRGFVVGNPKGFTTPSAFELDVVRIAVDPKSLLSNVIVIEEIYVAGPRVTYEVGAKGSNIGAIMKNVEKFTGPSAPAESSGEGASSEVKIRIKKFDFIDGKVALAMKTQLFKGKALSAGMPDLKLRDIGGENGTTPDKAAKEVMKPILSSVARSGKGMVGDLKGTAKEALDQAASAAQKGVKSLKGLFGR